jgi:processive 1,2-diacylglycerol beta-glucosyltransferase
MAKRILITSMNVGSGHRMPALAVEEALHERYGDLVTTRVVDFAHDVDAGWTDFMLKKSWNFMLGHPGFTNAMYDSVLEGHVTVSTKLPTIAMYDFFTRAPRFIARYRPDIIFSTYFFSTYAALLARRKGLYSGKVVQMVVDPFTAHPWWAMNRLCDEHYVASTQARRKLISLGVDPARVTRVAFPLRSAFEQENLPPRGRVLADLGLSPDLQTMLVSPGGEGITNIPQYIKQVCKHNLRFNIIYVCGRNEEAKADMEAFLAANPSAARVALLGYVDNIPELLNAADFAVAKPGASTTMETLLMRKPVIFTQYCGYQEKSNVEHVVNNHLGWHAKSLSVFLFLLRTINESNLLDVYRQRLVDLDLHSGSGEVARNVGRHLGLC